VNIIKIIVEMRNAISDLEFELNYFKTSKISANQDLIDMKIKTYLFQKEMTKIQQMENRRLDINSPMM
jgi:hypothetical protein